MEPQLKERVHHLVDEMPAGATLDDLLREIKELQSIERALADIAAGRLTPHDEACQLILSGSWRSAKRS